MSLYSNYEFRNNVIFKEIFTII